MTSEFPITNPFVYESIPSVNDLSSVKTGPTLISGLLSNMERIAYVAQAFVIVYSAKNS